MKLIIRNIIFSIIAFLIVLACAETLMRISGLIILHKNTSKNKSSASEPQYTILCLGDSFTYGVGAKPGDDYPTTLSSLFAQRLGNANVSVINAGIGGYNSAQVLQKLRQEMTIHKPDLVCVLVGVNNHWNYWGYSDYAERNILVSGALKFINDLKLYKLMRLFIANRSFSHIDDKKDMTASSQPNEILNEQDQERFSKALQFKDAGMNEKALTLLLTLVNKYPSFGMGYFLIGEIYESQGDRKKALEWFFDGIRAEPDMYFNYGGIIRILRFTNNSEKDGDGFEAFVRLLEKEIPKNNISRSVLRMMHKERLDEESKAWTKHDLLQLITLCKTRDIRVVLQTFPLGAVSNTVIRELSDEEHVLLVDQEKLFDALWVNGRDKETFMADDNIHVNAKGYALMAEYIYDALMKDKLIETEIRKQKSGS